MIGMKLSRGPPVSKSNNAFAQPHWNTAVVRPNVARILSRNPIVALIGTRMERKTRSRMTRDRITIIPI
ncbi:hypothetical protein D3C76_1610630 [compost metagenome]